MQSVCVLYVQKAKKSSSDTFVPLRIRWMFIFVVDAQGLSTNSRLLWRVVNSLKEPTREFHRALKSRARIFPPFDWSIDCHPVSSYRVSCQGFYRADPNFSRVSVLRGEMLNSIDSPLRVARENRNRKVRHWSSLNFVIFMAQKRIFFWGFRCSFGRDDIALNGKNWTASSAQKNICVTSIYSLFAPASFQCR